MVVGIVLCQEKFKYAKASGIRDRIIILSAVILNKPYTCTGIG